MENDVKDVVHLMPHKQIEIRSTMFHNSMKFSLKFAAVC